jgi:arabinofuranosyltransferase
LLSRLPSTRAWRIGHFSRRIPTGYLETLSSGVSEIQDPGVSELYRSVSLLTRAPIWSRERFVTVLTMAVGNRDDLLKIWTPHAATPDDHPSVGRLNQ